MYNLNYVDLQQYYLPYRHAECEYRFVIDGAISAGVMFSHLILKSDIARFKFFCAWRMTSVMANVKYAINYNALSLYSKPSIHYITAYFWHFDATFCIRANILANPCMEKLDWEYTRALRRVDHLLCFQIWWRIQQGYVSSCRLDCNTTCVSHYTLPLRTTIFQTSQCVTPRGKYQNYKITARSECGSLPRYFDFVSVF